MYIFGAMYMSYELLLLEHPQAADKPSHAQARPQEVDLNSISRPLMPSHIRSCAINLNTS